MPISMPVQGARFAVVAWILLPTMLLAAAGPVLSQEPGPARDASGRGSFEAGYLSLDLDDLNAELATAGLPALAGDFLTLGGSGFGLIGRLALGGEGHAVMNSKENTTDGSLQLATSGGYGLFRIGYMAASIGGIEIIPLAGIGAGGMTVDLIERSSPTFGQVIAAPNRSSRLSTAMFLLDASVVAHYRISLPTDPGEGEGGLVVGIHGGYVFSPAQTSWNLDGLNDVAGGPDLEIQGPYVRVTFGGWGREPGDRP